MTHRNWTSVPACEQIDKSVQLHLTDGAISWLVLMENLTEGHRGTNNLDFTEWQYCSSNGSDNIRFEYALDPTGKVHSVRAVHGHSGRPEVDVADVDCNEILFSVDTLAVLHHFSVRFQVDH